MNNDNFNDIQPASLEEVEQIEREYQASTKSRMVIDRLIIARKRAGLTQGQAAKLLGYSNASSLSQIETDYRNTEPTITQLFHMCDIYDVSIVWLLTGHNPDFDENKFNLLTQYSNAAIEDLDNLKELLKSLRQ